MLQKETSLIRTGLLAAAYMSRESGNQEQADEFYNLCQQLENGTLLVLQKEKLAECLATALVTTLKG